MQITARDIKEMGFAKKFNGYDIEEVRNFLEMVATEYEKLVLESTDLKENAKRMEREIENYRQKDENLNKILLTAQSFSDTERKRIQQESDLKIKETELTVRSMLEQAGQQKVKLEMEITELLMRKDEFIRRFTTLMEDQKRAFDDIKNGIIPQRLQNPQIQSNQSVQQPPTSEIDRIVEEKIVEEKRDIFSGRDSDG